MNVFTFLPWLSITNIALTVSQHLQMRDFNNGGAHSGLYSPSSFFPLKISIQLKTLQKEAKTN